MLWKIDGSVYCGGTIYKPGIVISAAHCCEYFQDGQVLLYLNVGKCQKQIFFSHLNQKMNKIFFFYPALASKMSDFFFEIY